MEHWRWGGNSPLWGAATGVSVSIFRFRAPMVHLMVRDGAKDWMFAVARDLARLSCAKVARKGRRQRQGWAASWAEP